MAAIIQCTKSYLEWLERGDNDERGRPDEDGWRGVMTKKGNPMWTAFGRGL